MADDVEIWTREGKAHYHGIMRCGHVWECPVCQLAVKAERVGEVHQVVEWHTGRYGRDCAVMLSLTVRHGMGDDLATVRKGVAKAFRRFVTGAPFQRQLERFGNVARIRALEVTHGSNGWHPHLHVILLSERPLDRAFGAWVSTRWQACVLSVLGVEHVPSDEHGCELTPCHKAEYLQKLGLELVAPGGKGGRAGNRTPLQLLAAGVCDGDVAALKLYGRYCAGMKGARMLTWSKGLKESAGVRDRTDEEIVEGADEPEEHVLMIKGEAWDELRDVPGIKSTILSLAESEPPDVVRQWLGQLPLWRRGYDPCEVQHRPRPRHACAQEPANPAGNPC